MPRAKKFWLLRNLDIAAGLMSCRAPSAPLPQRPAFDTKAPPLIAAGPFLYVLQDCIDESGKLPQIDRKIRPMSRQAEEAMERTEFLRKQAERFLRLAQECTDPEIRDQLVSKTNEYRDMLERAGA
jgi:hypothetical protein